MTITPEEEAVEAEIYNLVMVLKENPDERAIPVLEKVAERDFHPLLYNY